MRATHPLRFAIPLLLLPIGGGLACASAPVRLAPMPSVHVIGHRGCAGHAPENTLPAFEKALELGASEVELDVQLSRDGELVLFHDALLEKKTALRGRVADHPAALLLATDIGSWFDAEHPGNPERFAGTTLTTLPEVFERFGRSLYYHVEVKAEEPELPGRILASLRDAGLRDRATVTSFSFDQIARVRALDAEIPTTWLIEEVSQAVLERAAAVPVTGVALRADQISADWVARGRALGLDVRAWGVSSPELMERALAAGASGMTIDWPDLLIERLSRPPALANY